MPRLDFRMTILFLLAVVGATGSIVAQDRGKPPNIILLLVDDMGYGDLTCYGGQAVHTPNIDALAREGIRFTRFYSASAVCTPSRAAILTGKYPLRFDIRQHFKDQEEFLPEHAVTLAEKLSQAGYATAHIGKWHLGGLRLLDLEARSSGDVANPGPMQHGFDHTLTSIEGDPPRPHLIKDRRLYRDGGQYMIRNDRRAPAQSEHWTNIKVTEAVGLLHQRKKEQRPFFLNIWFDVPHTPYEPAPEPHLGRYARMGATGDQLHFRSMVSNLDENIGRLIETLRNLELYEETLIIFTSDNGAAWEGEVGPFKGGKTDLHEGGIRVPFFAVWPNHIRPNQVSLAMGHHNDLFPTICAAAQLSVRDEQLDGKNLLPHLIDGTVLERGPIFWQMDLYKNLQRHYPKPHPYATGIVYEGPWKLLVDSITPVALYHLENDPHEVRDQLDQQPKLVERLKAANEKFLAEPRRSWK